MSDEKKSVALLTTPFNTVMPKFKKYRIYECIFRIGVTCVKNSPELSDCLYHHLQLLEACPDGHPLTENDKPIFVPLK